ncbi:MAG TPA: EAL domain-containing protein [Pirellulales bacterium]|jgi:EAL domain-containing protein (putative c-di-GMP-specific phosphodiesterase class I)
MQTQLMEKRVVGVPWLERDREGAEPLQHPLHSFPFSIGRVESADLQIDDSRVSREHAVILREGKNHRIRDLHSTNGTLLNGQRVQDAELNDGDILVIAGVEFTFYAERSGRSYSMATEVAEAGNTTNEAAQTRELVRAIRRLQQSLTQRSVDVHFRPIIDLASHRIFGYEALRSSGEAPANGCEQMVLASAPRVAGHLYQLARLIAAEESTRHGLGDNLFLPVEAAEIGSDAVLDSLARLTRLTPVGHRLVATIPEAVVCDIPYFQTLRQGLRELGIRAAYQGFAGTHAQVMEKRTVAPDFLILAASLTTGIQRQPERQRQLQSVVRACHDLGSVPIATGLQIDDELRTCHDLGIPYGSGNVFGRPGQATSLADRAIEHTLEASLRR